MEVNLPDVHAELEAKFLQYERALTENIVDDLTQLFWDSEMTLRYGAREMLYSAKAIHAFRAARPAGPRPRELLRYVISTFGSDYGIANAEFRALGDPRLGRQSQTWVRMEQGWRIVAAHVSFLDSDDFKAAGRPVPT
ncbi:oxalurate catabolism protein HpxZ [soil metagenome]